MIYRVCRRFLQRLDDMGRGRRVRVALSQVNDVMARGNFAVHLLHERGKKLRRQLRHHVRFGWI